MISIEIEVADDGKVTVGVQPPDEEAAAGDVTKDKSYMQPAKSVDDALSTAKDLIAQQSQVEGQANSSSDQAMGDTAMMSGFQGVRGNTSIGG